MKESPPIDSIVLPDLWNADASARRSRQLLFSALWIAVGTFWIALCLYGWSSWIFSADRFQPVPRGADVLSHNHLIWIRIIEGTSVLATLWILHEYWIKPLRKGLGLTLEGKILIGCCFGIFWDPVVNYFHWTFAWNTYALNMGDWLHWIPGHQSEFRYAEGLLWAAPQYLYLGLVTAVVMLKGIDAMRRHGIGFWPALVAMYAVFFVVDIAWESFFIHVELYAYPRGLSWFTLWPGTHHQLPLNESVSVALYPVSMVFLLVSARDPRGSVLDRGLARLTPRKQKFFSLLAVIGFCAIRPGITYFIPWAFISTVSDSIVTNLPTYLMYAPDQLH